MATPRYETASRNCNTVIKTPRYRKSLNGLLESPIKSAYNQPGLQRFGHLSVRELAGVKEDPAFGFEPFLTPKCGLEHRICHFAPSKSKNISFVDI